MFVVKTGTTKVVNTRKAQQITLSAYTSPPLHDFNIDQFETLAIARLNVLRWIDTQLGLGFPLVPKPGSSGTSDKKNTNTPANKTYLEDILSTNNLLRNRSDDIISHFIGRLCFCQTNERRRWFMQAEKALFEFRYKYGTIWDRAAVERELCSSNNREQPFEIYDKQKLINQDLSGKAPIIPLKLNMQREDEKTVLPYYKIPFEEVFQLVARKAVYLRDGFAYVPSSQFISIITGKFRMHLNKGLAASQRALDKMKNDPVAMNSLRRVLHIIEGLHKITAGPKYQQSNQTEHLTIRAVDIKRLARHFPPCMQHSLHQLCHTGHAKHGARMCFGLFLKGIGLSLPEAMKFWRSKFTKIGSEKFDKQYGYNVRHNYGKEGKRISYSPYACSKIISAAPNAGDYYGCPFKLFDETNLRRYLGHAQKMSYNDIESVVGLVTNGNAHYQLACRQVFAIQNHVVMKRNKIAIDDIESSWAHPNEYFDHSYEMHHPKKTVEVDLGEGGSGGQFQTQTQKNTQGFTQTQMQTKAQLDDFAAEMIVDA